MVGTTKWQEEWKVVAFDCNDAGKSKTEITLELHARFPRSGKDFNASAVRYILGTVDPRGPKDQVMGRGIKKKKKYPGKASSQSSAGVMSDFNALNQLSMAMPAGASYNTAPGSSYLQNPQLRNAAAGMGPPYAGMGAPYGGMGPPYPSFNDSHPQGSLAASYAAAGMPGSNGNSRFTYENGHDGLHQSMQWSATDNRSNIAAGGQEQNATNPYLSSHNNHIQYMQNAGYAQPQQSQMPAATNNSIAQNAQGSQSIVPSNIGRAGFGQRAPLNPTSGTMQQNISQAPPHPTFQGLHDLPASTSSSTNQNIEGSIGRNAGPSRGLPKHTNSVPGGDAYAQSNRTGSYQDMSVAQHSQNTMGNGHNSNHMANANSSTTMGSRQYATLKKPSSHSARKRDDFDFEEADEFDPRYSGLGAVSSSALAPSSQLAAPRGGIRGSKRKHQEEAEGPVHMSAAGGNIGSVDGPNKRQKQGSSAAVMTNMVNAAPSIQRSYDPVLLEQYKKDNFNRTPEELFQTLKEHMKNTATAQGGNLSEEEQVTADSWINKIRQDSTSMLRSQPPSQNSEQSQRRDEHPGASLGGGMPQSSISLEQQQNQFKIMQDKLTRGSNGGGSGGAILKQSGIPQSYQQASQQNMNLTPSMVGADAQGSGKNTPNLIRPPMSSAPQQGRVPGNGTGIAPHSRPTSSISRLPVSSAPQQGRVNGNETGVAPNSRPISTQPGRASENGTGVVPSSQISESTQRTMFSQQPQLNGNGFNQAQTPSGYPSYPNIGGRNEAQKHLPSQIPTAYITSYPQSIAPQIPTAYITSYPQSIGGMQPPAVRQPQGVMQPPTDRPSGPYQSLYPPLSGTNQIHDQSLHRAFDGAVTGRPPPEQSFGVKTPIPSSKPGNSTDQSSQPATAPSLNTSARNSSGTAPAAAAAPAQAAAAAADDMIIVDMRDPIFESPFAFPTTYNGWSTTLNHADQEYKVERTDLVIIMHNPKFLGGVIWPMGQEPPVQTVTGPAFMAPPPPIPTQTPRYAPQVQNTSVPASASSNITAPPAQSASSSGNGRNVSKPTLANPAVPVPVLPKPVAPAQVERKKPDDPIDYQDDDDLGGLFGDGDDLSGEVPDFTDNVSGSSTSVRSGDQTSKPSSDLTLPVPAVGDTPQEGETTQSSLDKARSATRDSLAPKSIITASKGTQQGEEENQGSAGASSSHVQKPEVDMLTDENAVEWRARHPIAQQPKIQFKSPILPPRKKVAGDIYSVAEPFVIYALGRTPWLDSLDPAYEDGETPENVESRIKSQKKWLKAIFPHYPKLDRLDVQELKRERVTALDVANAVWHDVSVSRQYNEQPGNEDWKFRGNLEVEAALAMLVYVHKWGELCTQFDKNGYPDLKLRPDPSRKAFNEQMAKEIREEKMAAEKRVEEFIASRPPTKAALILKRRRAWNYWFDIDPYGMIDGILPQVIPEDPVPTVDDIINFNPYVYLEIPEPERTPESLPLL